MGGRGEVFVLRSLGGRNWRQILEACDKKAADRKSARQEFVSLVKELQNVESNVPSKNESSPKRLRPSPPAAEPKDNRRKLKTFLSH